MSDHSSKNSKKRLPVPDDKNAVSPAAGCYLVECAGTDTPKQELLCQLLLERFRRAGTL